MKKKKKPSAHSADSAGFDNLSDPVDFYSSGTGEQPLAGGHSHADLSQIRKTDRHQAVGGRQKQNVDLRERMALVTILKSVFMILLLMIAFAMLWKGIKIYEESVWLEDHAVEEESPVMREVVMVDNFDLSDERSREQFAERVEIWKEAERLLGRSEALLARNNHDEAIKRCQDTLRLDPAHRGALDLLGRLYFAKQRYVEAANAYIRLLSVDPSNNDVQRRLIRALDAVGDHEAVRYMAEWYLSENLYDTEVQSHLANALFAGKSYLDAAAAYRRVLQEAPGDVAAMEQLAASYLLLDDYKNALAPLQKLRDLNYRNPVYYRQIAVCNAQLEKGYETVQILGRAAQIFGDKVVMAWMQDSRLDPVRDDRNFQAFADHVGGEGFRKWLDKMAEGIESSGKDASEVGAMLDQPESQQRDANLLQQQPQQ